MNRDQLARLLTLIARTEDDEISCSVCFELLPPYVDLEVAGEAPDRHAARLRQHLEQCGVCREEYETLRDLVRRETDDT